MLSVGDAMERAALGVLSLMSVADSHSSANEKLV